MSAVIIWRLLQPFEGIEHERTFWVYNAPVLTEDLENAARAQTPEGFYLHKIITPIRTLLYDKEGVKSEIPNFKLK